MEVLMKVARVLLFAATAVLLPSAVRPAAAQEWQFYGAAYAWLAGLDGTIGAGPAGGGQPVEASFSDLASYIDFAAAGHFEARNAKVVLLTDINYVGLGAERDADVEGVPVTIDMDYNQWIIEAGGGYRISENFDALLVGRYYIQDLGGTVTSIGGDESGETSHKWADMYVGGRYSNVLGGKWVVSVRGDVGFGGSDIAWFGNALVGYRLGKTLSLGLAYRVLSLDYETGEGVDYYKYDVTMDGVGLVLGIGL
jgi:hypothetical protein